MKKISAWMLRQAKHKNAPWVLSALSFGESSFSPIPPDPMLIAMAVANPKRGWYYATLCTIASCVGGIFGYLIGYYLFESIGTSIIEFYNLSSAFDKLKYWFQQYGFWIIAIKGLTPIPYKVVTITSGATQINLLVFFVASFLTRGMRYYFEAYVFWRYGDKINGLLKKYGLALLIVTIIVTIAGFYMIKYIV